MHQALPLSLALFAIAAIGCGGAAIPHDQLASSQASIRAAEEVGANKYPTAQLHLRFAKDQVEKAKALIEDGEIEEAKLVLQRAQADADLAIAITKENAVRADAEQALSQVAALRQQIQQR
ncbi:MAG TPA: DUF4398 domain-containing protein [Polyangiaceae bacterium]|nr:DUF4398 domain-containing protein [Polyangiaceae bacterium]